MQAEEIKKLHKQIKKLQKSELKIQQEIQNCENWPTIQHEGDLIKFYYSSIPKGSRQIELFDWLTNQPYPIQLDPKNSIQVEMSSRFKKAKKLKRGIIPLHKYLKHIQNELSLSKDKLAQLEEAIKTHNENLNSDHIQTKELEKKLAASASSSQSIQKKKNPKKNSVYKEYCSQTGIKIWVGRNAKCNDKLTFHFANGLDWWLHIRDFPGSHVIIKSQNPDEETLKDAFQLALHYSKAREQQEGEVCFTQRKHISRMGNKPGLVQVSSHKSAWVHFDSIRYERLKTHSSKHHV